MYRIRDMRVEDIPQVEALEARLFSDGWSQDSLKSSMEQSHVKIVIAEDSRADESRVVGYHIFYIAIDEGDVARIAVHPDYRRQGIGDELLRFVWKYCLEVGVHRALLEVRESNASAIALYEKHGFVQLGVRKGYYQNPLEDGVIMEMQIDITTGN